MVQLIFADMPSPIACPQQLPEWPRASEVMLQVLETLTDEFCANMAALVADRFGTHVGRMLLCVVAGQDIAPKSQSSAVSCWH